MNQLKSALLGLTIALIISAIIAFGKESATVFIYSIF